MKVIPALSVVSFLFIAVLTASGCAVKYISSYDELTDKNVTQLQRKTESFLIDLGTKDGLPECSYQNNANFYTETKVDLSAIEVRAKAIPQNDTTVKQLFLLNESLNLLEKLHKLKDKKSQSSGELRCFSPDELLPTRNALNSSFTAILKLEFAKKRGEIN